MEINNLFDFFIASFMVLGGITAAIYKIDESNKIIFFLRTKKYRRKKLGKGKRAKLLKALIVNIIFILLVIIFLFFDGHFMNYFTQVNTYIDH